MQSIDTSDARISRDQSLALKSKILGYIRDALIYDDGYVVFEVKDVESVEFDFYYTSGVEIVPRYEETRAETIDRILFTISCKELTQKRFTDEEIEDLIGSLYNHVIGFVNYQLLQYRFGVEDHTNLFKNE